MTAQFFDVAEKTHLLLHLQSLTLVALAYVCVAAWFVALRMRERLTLGSEPTVPLYDPLDKRVLETRVQRKRHLLALSLPFALMESDSCSDTNLGDRVARREPFRWDEKLGRLFAMGEARLVRFGS